MNRSYKHINVEYPFIYLTSKESYYSIGPQLCFGGGVGTVNPAKTCNLKFKMSSRIQFIIP